MSMRLSGCGELGDDGVEHRLVGGWRTATFGRSTSRSNAVSTEVPVISGLCAEAMVAAPIQRSGNSKALENRSTSAHEEQRRVRAVLHDLSEVAGVVDVVVGDEDVTHIGRIDQPEHAAQPLRPVGDGAGVDDHRLGAADHHRVQVHAAARREAPPAPDGSPRRRSHQRGLDQRGCLARTAPPRWSGCPSRAAAPRAGTSEAEATATTGTATTNAAVTPSAMASITGRQLRRAAL